MVELNAPIISKSGNILLTRNHLISHDVYNSDKVIWVFDRKSLINIGKIGVVGQGPGEISQSGFICVSTDNVHLWLYDAGKQKMMLFELGDTLKVQPKRIYSIPSKLGMLMQFAQTDKRPGFVSQNFLSPDEFSFVEFNLIDDSVRFFGKPYISENVVSDGDYFLLYPYSFSAHSNGNLFIRAYLNFDVIQLIDRKGEIAFEHKKEMNTQNFVGEMAYYRNVRASDKYIYAEYVGAPYLNESGDGPNYPNEIRIFDWELNPVAKLVLDQKIISFDVDVKNERLIAWSQNEDSPLIWFNYSEDDL